MSAWTGIRLSEGWSNAKCWAVGSLVKALLLCVVCVFFCCALRSFICPVIHLVEPIISRQNFFLKFGVPKFTWLLFVGEAYQQCWCTSITEIFCFSFSVTIPAQRTRVSDVCYLRIRNKPTFEWSCAWRESFTAAVLTDPAQNSLGIFSWTIMARAISSSVRFIRSATLFCWVYKHVLLYMQCDELKERWRPRC